MEYLRALRYELRALPHFDQVQVCTPAQSRLSAGLPCRTLAPKLRDGLRAGIDTSHYEFRPDGREPVDHAVRRQLPPRPQSRGLDWFVREVLPLILEREPQRAAGGRGIRPAAGARLCRLRRRNLEMLGFVDDVREPLAQYAVFVCPILSGSGVRVKLLEAFAAGIPGGVDHSRRGRPGEEDGEFCALATIRRHSPSAC